MRASVPLVRHIALLLLSGCSLFGAEGGLKPASETKKMWDTHRQTHTHENPHSNSFSWNWTHYLVQCLCGANSVCT